MAEYCEYMWEPSRGPATSALARSIYGEDTRLDKRDKKLAIKTVRAILREMPDVDLKHCTDEYITRFLLARKYRTEQAAALIAAYQAQVAHRQDIFGNLTARDPALQRALRAGIPGVLPARDRKGRCVLVILASQWDPVAVPALSVQRALFLVLEILIQDPRNQQSGFVAVVDWSGFSLRQGGALGAAALRNLIAALRGRFPARFKAIHFLSAPLYVQATLALVKPFLDEKTRHKIYLHGNNLSTLHEHLPTDILPAELGGTGPAFNPGLWAEPVIHSAMKEAEVAAAQREKERAERLERARTTNDKASPSIATDPSNGESFKAADRAPAESPERQSMSQKSAMKSFGPFGSFARNDERKPKDVEMNLMNKDANVARELAKRSENNETSEKNERSEKSEKKGTNEKNDNNDRLVDIEEAQNGNYDHPSKPDNGNANLEDDLTFLELQSETNSNEFEMVPSRPDSDESKDNSLDNRPERILLRTGRSENPSEVTNLIT